ncbi:NCS1 nucleoside transporter family protein [Trichophyton equinum CBS 127.97]|uniref:NCS1 nucleoside transporter family protein n=1 Tax=Trichophyton equinum (strain ATCC MYA-4606 / CBS 127.97) TaxID=559882 RepID=F2Q4D7_TRIEC|nr:NCS1 nucleoside transporter family protein [Trichophyton equinum CBS 127.97]
MPGEVRRLEFWPACTANIFTILRHYAESQGLRMYELRSGGITEMNRILKKLEIEHEGGTLPDPWINFDIKPIEAGRRTWSAWTFTTYWVLINSNISSYMTGSSLIALGLHCTIGAISAGILNQNDYARFARKPRDAILGQVISFPISSIVCSVIGVLVTAATQKRFGKSHWDLPSLIGAIIDHGGSRSRAAAFFAGGALVISQIGVNIPGNALSGGFDLAATFPKYINIRRGAYITIALSVACNPWKLVSTATIFLSVLSSYAVFLGPMTGLMISAWFIVHRRKLKVEDLYTGNRTSIYWFSHGFNWRAFIAWICGTVPSLPGFIATVNTDVHVPVGFTRIYQLCFLVGFLISAFVYSGLHVLVPDRKLQEYVSTAASPVVLIRDYRDSIDRGQGLVGNKSLSDA